MSPFAERRIRNITAGLAARQVYPNERIVAYAMLILSTVLIGSGNVAQVTASEKVGAFTMVACRSIIAVIFLLPFAISELKTVARWERDIMPCAAAAALYFAASMLAQQMGAATTTATNIGFLINMSAVFVPMLLWFAVKETPPAMAWPSAAVAVVGAYLVTGAGGVSSTWGDLLCLLAGLMDAIWIIALGVLVPKCKAPACLVLLMYLASAMVASPGVIIESDSLAAIWTAMPEAMWLGVMSSGLGFLFSTKAQATLPACAVAVVFCFEAIVSAIFGRLFLGELMTVPSYVGAALIILAVVLPQLALRKKSSVYCDKGDRLIVLRKLRQNQA
jgi:drug/metabolite transporter (DMT)-like permease